MVWAHFGGGRLGDGAWRRGKDRDPTSKRAFGTSGGAKLRMSQRVQIPHYEGIRA